MSTQEGHTPVRRRGKSLDRAATRDLIIESARELFVAPGVRATTMEMVARRAGIVRQSLYEMVPNRDELVRMAIMARCTEIIEAHVRPVMPRSASFADGVVGICAMTIDLVRHDPELVNLFEATGKYKITEFLAGPHPAMHELVASVFADAFAQARDAGEVRTDIDEDGLNDWIRGVVLMLLLRTDLTPERERELLKSFLVPSLLHPVELHRQWTDTNHHGSSMEI